jgi:3-oxoacyl-[acyl-carrier protein] reductase
VANPLWRLKGRGMGQVGGAPGRAVLRRLGVPVPAPLTRYRPDGPGGPAVPGPVVLGGAGRLGSALASAITAAGAVAQPAEEAKPGADVPGAGNLGTDRPAALVYDATGLDSPAALGGLYEFVHSRIRDLAPSGRILIVGDVPAPAASARTGASAGAATTAGAAAVAQALEGFTRSLGKEMRGGGTSQLLRVAPGGEACLDSPLRFLLSPRSAYVSGQVITVEPATRPETTDWDAPLRGRHAAVTGAARGIGAVIAEILARDGAHVLCLDLPGQAGPLSELAGRIGGTALPVDITAPGAPREIAARLRAESGGVDVFVHNAGVTRDRTIAAMLRADWDAVLDVNLGAVMRITDALLSDVPDGPDGHDGPVLRDGGALVCVSSVAGIAGNRGQTSYAASKAGLIGLVRALAPGLRVRNRRINAVAPGFIETDMTARMPLLVREAGRRMNSLGQGGLPADVAEAVAWLAAPATAGVTGQVLRVCGQSLLGA